MRTQVLNVLVEEMGIRNDYIHITLNWKTQANGQKTKNKIGIIRIDFEKGKLEKIRLHKAKEKRNLSTLSKTLIYHFLNYEQPELYLGGGWGGGIPPPTRGSSELLVQKPELLHDRSELTVRIFIQKFKFLLDFCLKINKIFPFFEDV